MFIDLTEEQQALLAELREYFSGLMTQEERTTLLTERHGAVLREDGVDRVDPAGPLPGRVLRSGAPG